MSSWEDGHTVFYGLRDDLVVSLSVMFALVVAGKPYPTCTEDQAG